MPVLSSNLNRGDIILCPYAIRSLISLQIVDRLCNLQLSYLLSKTNCEIVLGVFEVTASLQRAYLDASPDESPLCCKID